MAHRDTTLGSRPPRGAKHRHCALFLAVSVALLATASPVRAGDAARFAGTWQHVGGESEQRGLLSAIDGCVAELNFLVRPLARHRLVQSSKIPNRVVIEAEATQVSVQQGGGAALASRLGSVRPVTSAEGETIELSFRMQQDTLVQRVANPDGARQTVYRLDGAGKRLVAEVTTSSRFFSHALVYTLTFERVTSEQLSRAIKAPLSPSL